MTLKKTLVLDIGGVFFDPAWRREGVQHAARLLNVPDNRLSDALKKNRVPFYTGSISENVYWERVLRDLTMPLERGGELEELYRYYVRPIPETLDLLPQLATKYRLVACNNAPKEWMDYRIKIASLGEFFERFATSGYLGVMKPDVGMYASVFDEKTKLGGVTYIDDNEEYVSIVQKIYGIPSRLYTTTADLLVWIR